MSTLFRQVEQLEQRTEAFLDQFRGGVLKLPDSQVLSDLRDEVDRTVRHLNERVRRLAQWSADGLIIDAVTVNEAWGDVVGAAGRFLAKRQLWEEWAAFCVTYDVAGGATIDADALNQFDWARMKSDGLREGCRSLQEAVLGRFGILKCLGVVHGLCRVDPSDRFLGSLASSLEERALGQVERAVSTAVGSRNVAELQTAKIALEGLNWGSPAAIRIRREIDRRLSQFRLEDIRARYQAVVDKVGAVAGQDFASDQDPASVDQRLMSLGRLQDEWAAVESETGEPPELHHASAVKNAFAWADERRAGIVRELEYQRHIEDFRRGVEQSDDTDDRKRLFQRIEAHELPVPADIQRHMQRIQSAEDGRSQQRSFMIKAAVVALVLCLITGVWLTVSAVERQRRAAAKAADLTALLEKGELGKVEEQFAGIDQAEPELLDSSDLMAVRARLNAGLERWKSRRHEVEQQLQSAQSVIRRSMSARASGLPAARAYLAALVGNQKSTESLLKDVDPNLTLIEAERASADKILEELDLERQRMLREIEPQLERTLAEVAKEWAAIGGFDDQPSDEKNSSHKIGEYRERVVKWGARTQPIREDLKEWALVAPEEFGPIYERVLALIERCNRASGDATARLDSLESYNKRLVQLTEEPAKPVTPSEWLGQVVQFRLDHEGMLKLNASDDKLLGELIKAAELATAIERLHDEVGVLRCPIELDERDELLSKIKAWMEDSAVQSCPPLAAEGQQWIDFLSKAFVDKAVKELLKLRNLEDLLQTKLKDDGWVFSRPSTLGQFERLVLSRADLERQPSGLGPSKEIQLRVVSKEHGAPFSERLKDALQQFDAESTMEQRVTVFLRFVEDLAEGSKPTFVGARAAVALTTLEALTEWCNIGLIPGVDEKMAERVAECLKSHRAVMNDDWPRLASQAGGPPEQVRRRATDAIKAVKDLQLYKVASEVSSMQWTALSFVAIGYRSQGSQDKPRFRVSPPSVESGTYQVAVLKEGRWTLEPISVSQGMGTTTGRLAAPMIFIFRREQLRKELP